MIDVWNKLIQELVSSREKGAIILAYVLVENKAAFAEWIWINEETAAGYGLPFVSYSLAELVEEAIGIREDHGNESARELKKSYEEMRLREGDKFVNLHHGNREEDWGT